MLRELHIQNLAVIQDITVELHPGFNCFTGQTGAGKSLIIGALEVLLGLRQATDMLRKGAAEGRVTAVFQIKSRNLRQEIANATDLPLEEEPELIIARRLFESGRTSASLNGHPITGAMLKHVGEILVDVHGQHDAQYLLKPANQLAVIDEFAGDGTVELRRRFSELFHQRQSLAERQQELTAGRTLRRQQLELYEFQAREIDDAQLAAGEHDALTARSKVLANLEKLKRTGGAAYGALYEEEGSILERLKTTAAVLNELAGLDESLVELTGQVRDAAVSLDDAAFSLRRYVDRLDLDPAELAQVMERLNLLNRLVDKYTSRNGTVEEVLTYREQIGGTIEELRVQDQDFSSIAGELAGVQKELNETGRQLTVARQRAAQRLAPLVHRELADLGMKEARFAVEFTRLDVGIDNGKPEGRGSKIDGLKLGAGDFATASGFEMAEFMIAPNPGQPARPLRRIASGGELSRIMLALKGILAERGGADRVSVLVFDEIDANVGGRMGSVIGEKLRALAGIHQVLCITHLPQIAAFADRHLTIRKAAQAGETATSVTVMEGEDRIRELAEMTAGGAITVTALAQARELLHLGQPRGGRVTARKSVKR